MKKIRHLPWLLAFNALLLIGVAIICAVGNKAVNTVSESVVFFQKKIIIIDAGHGGIDGGATSCTGVLESKLNLEIALRLDDLFHLLGIPTRMVRQTDRSVHTQGDSIAAQKVSDLKNRVAMINQTKNSVVISIHQNYFQSSQYAGAQVFYSDTEGSNELAKLMQEALVGTINKGSKRKSKRASGIYLMEHIERPGILLECGFLSNPEEEYKLRSDGYQKELCCVIATVCANFLNNRMLT